MCRPTMSPVPLGRVAGQLVTVSAATDRGADAGSSGVAEEAVMVMVQSGAVVAAVFGFYSFLSYLLFVHRVTRYSDSHSHAETLEFADVIRPTVVAAIAKVASRSAGPTAQVTESGQAAFGPRQRRLRADDPRPTAASDGPQDPSY